MPPSTERVTVTLPREMVREIERFEKNRSRFMLDAVRHEIERRHREELRRSLDNPHPESESLTEEGFDLWVRTLPGEDAAGLVDLKAGKSIRWIAGQGWKEIRK